jgi:predicted N-formylglutamate amidohydrolase
MKSPTPGGERTAPGALLAPDDPAPALAVNPRGASRLVLIGDHAGRAVPGKLAQLGAPVAAFDQHIALDIGVAGLGAALSARLDACFIHQAYSRLVIDCNRVPGSEGSILAVSDRTRIPGNEHLSAADADVRLREIYQPYQDRIAAALEDRVASNPLLVALHSFTPALQGVARPWRYGVLHRNDSRLSFAMLAALRAVLGDLVGDNQPYAMDGTDNTIPLHVDARGIDYVELEVRQDLIGEAAGQHEAAALIAAALQAALAALG